MEEQWWWYGGFGFGREKDDGGGFSLGVLTGFDQMGGLD